MKKITIPDEATAEAIKSDIAGQTAEVIKVERRKRSRKATGTVYHIDFATGRCS